MENIDIKKDARKRINIMKGHLNALSNMIKEGRSCTCLLDQSRAIQNSLKSLDTLIIEKYLKYDLLEQIRKNESAIRSSAKSNLAASPLREDLGYSFSSSPRQARGFPEAIVKEFLGVFKRRQKEVIL